MTLGTLASVLDRRLGAAIDAYRERTTSWTPAAPPEPQDVVVGTPTGPQDEETNRLDFAAFTEDALEASAATVVDEHKRQLGEVAYVLESVARELAGHDGAAMTPRQRERAAGSLRRARTALLEQGAMEEYAGPSPADIVWDTSVGPQDEPLPTELMAALALLMAQGHKHGITVSTRS